MKFVVKGKGEVTLTQQHYVATGGQASVYLKSGTAYKVYTDPKDMIPEAKFHDLARIQDQQVIKPQNILLDANNVPVGYTMDAVPGPRTSLCQLFTPAFRTRNGINNDHIIGLVAKLQGHIENVHKADVVIVDLNELNIMVPNTFDETFLIDVDSYQTKGYPATVIMPSVRDWSCHATNFSQLSDWYSLAILSFQLFVGAHPYRGGHAGSAQVPKDERLKYRMQHNISAFRTDVTLPKSCYSLDVIPQGYRDWLKAVLDDGKRCHPPDPRGGPATVIVTQALPQFLSGALVINEAMDLEGWHLASYAESQMTSIAVLRNETDLRALLSGRIVYSKPSPKGLTLAGLTPKNNAPFALNLHEGTLSYIDFTTKQTTKLEITADELAKSEDRFYIRRGPRILELSFYEPGPTPIITASHVVANVMEHASSLYEGCVIQSMAGSAFVSLLTASKVAYQVRVPELDPYNVVEAKFDGGVLMVVGAKAGTYDRFVFRFSGDYQTYDTRKVPDIQTSGLNFVTLTNGVCVAVTEDEKIEAFSAKKDAQGLKIIDDQAIGNDMRLLKLQGRVGFSRGTKLFNLRMK
jgi:hypothetical protein